MVLSENQIPENIKSLMIMFIHFVSFKKNILGYPFSIARCLNLPRSQRLLLERQKGAASSFAEYLAVLPDAGTKSYQVVSPPQLTSSIYHLETIVIGLICTNLANELGHRVKLFFRM
jgi:hypothetical protein